MHRRSINVFHMQIWQQWLWFRMLVISGVGIWFFLTAGIMIAINWLLMPYNELWFVLIWAVLSDFMLIFLISFVRHCTWIQLHVWVFSNAKNTVWHINWAFIAKPCIVNKNTEVQERQASKIHCLLLINTILFF